MIEIELRHPASIHGAPAKPQSLWMLLAMWQMEAMRERRKKGLPALLTTAHLQAQFPDVKHLRMLISRAFVDFNAWQIRVAWGTDFAMNPAMRSTRNRSHGPFWLMPGVFETINVQLNGVAATVAQVQEYLQIKSEPVGLASSTPKAKLSTQKTTHASADYWRAFAIAKREQQEGHLIVDGQHGALAGYRLSERLAQHPRQSAFALLQQAMVWRRAGNPDAALSVLKQLPVQIKRFEDGQWISAMAMIVQAWCAYAHRDLRAAARILTRAEQSPTLSAAFAHHPRVQAERANLRALLHRAAALDDQRSMMERERSADLALNHYHQALDLASEAELFDTAASAASNLGWSIWLFARCKLALSRITSESRDALDNHGARASSIAQSQAMQWIALANLLNEQHGSSGGFWNQIYLLRVARDGGMAHRPKSLLQFQQWPVLSCKEYTQQFAPQTSTSLGTTWLQRVRALHTDVQQGRLQVDALQRCNMLMELAWYESYEGDIDAARAALASLKKRLPELVVTDRSYFRQALRGLPI